MITESLYRKVAEDIKAAIAAGTYPPGSQLPSEAELAERAEVGFPPAVRMAAVEGPPAAVAEICDAVLGTGRVDPSPPEGVELLGPVEIDPPDRPGAGHGAADEVRERALLRVPRRAGRDLARALHDAQALRTARKAPETVRVRLDPDEID